MQVEKSDQALSAIVLAGGQSSRMGRDKALIAPQGVPLLKQIYEIAVKCASPVYVVTPWPERYQDILPNSCRFIREEPLPDETEPHGPLVGLAQGLAQVQTQWVLVLACDLPRLRVEVLQSWIGLLGDVEDDAIALLPRDAKGWQPLCGFYRHSCLPALQEFINQGGRSFQRWLSQHPVQEVPVSDRQMLFNCNTPTDLEQVKHET
ncbi:molybdenum cofactor guanylyltransferase [Microcoleus sp. FACHB-68]|uniref:molybdenum cofactor guanylyltransferase n=1 Tax=Microcoleus sp. FACHB-68 TaxID=2692826 RepID=UPI00168216A3|nr:molybdenum cofactor guanylyltransferase [Microcoleus sp. FACHB-68]MBD1936943.1 molybdenum cofactor guanylyltransferase [Microcoleus sp. FACHB-68]